MKVNEIKISTSHNATVYSRQYVRLLDGMFESCLYLRAIFNFKVTIKRQPTLKNKAGNE
jgi:hypothetical protein